MLSRLSVKLLVLVTAPIIMLVPLLLTMLWFNSELARARDSEVEAKEFQTAINGLLIFVQRYTFWRQGSYLTTGTFNDDVEKKFAAALQKKFAKIEKIVAGDEELKRKFHRVRQITQDVHKDIAVTEQMYRDGNKAGAMMKWHRVTETLEELDAMLSELSDVEEERMNDYRADITTYDSLVRNLGILATAVSVFAVFASVAIVNRNMMTKLRIIMENVERSEANQPLKIALNGRDELDQLDQSIHRMHDTLGVLRRKERAILENAVDLICALDEDLKFTDANPAAYEVVGFYAEDLLFRRAVDLVIEDEREVVRNKLKAVLTANGASYFESTMRRPDGKVVSLSWSVAAVSEEKSIYAVIRDITQRKELERMKRDFVAMVSHDIRAPLGNIQMVISLLEAESEALTPSGRRGLTLAEANTRRLLTLVNNLLDVEKIESGMLQILPEQHSAKKAARSAIEVLEMTAKERGIAIVEELDSDISAYFDEEKIVQVLVNLLGNALKFSPRDSQIKISASREADFVRFSVSDRGRGIPPDKINTVFDRFGQVERSDSTNKKGAGLGLTICKAIVEKHGGIIGVDSEVDKGSTFWFTLPTSERK